MPNGSGALLCGSNWRRVYQSLSTQQAGILLIIRMHKQGGWDGRRSRSVSFSPVCLCASYNDIICQKIQSAAGLHWVWLTKDMKQKIEIWGRVLLKLYIQLRKGKLRWYFGLLLTRKLFLLFFFLGERILPLPVHSTKQILTPASWAGRNRLCWLLWTADVERGEEEEAEKLMNKGGFTIQWRFQS